MLLADDPQARATLLHALLLVGAAQAGIDDPPGYDGPPLDAPELIPWAIAEVAAILAARLTEAGGDPGAVMASIYLAVTRGETKGAGHG